MLFGDSLLFGASFLFGDSLLFGASLEFGASLLFGASLVFGDSLLFGASVVFGARLLFGASLASYAIIHALWMNGGTIHQKGFNNAGRNSQNRSTLNSLRS